MNATTHFEVDDRQLPTAEVPVDDTEFDLRGGVLLGELTLDDGFGGAIMRDGVSEHSVSAPDGRTVTVWGDENFALLAGVHHRPVPGPVEGRGDRADDGADGCLQLRPGAEMARPGETWEASWGVRADGFAPV